MSWRSVGGSKHLGYTWLRLSVSCWFGQSHLIFQVHSTRKVQANALGLHGAGGVSSIFSCSVLGHQLLGHCIWSRTHGTRNCLPLFPSLRDWQPTSDWCGCFLNGLSLLCFSAPRGTWFHCSRWYWFPFHCFNCTVCLLHMVSPHQTLQIGQKLTVVLKYKSLCFSKL